MGEVWEGQKYLQLTRLLNQSKQTSIFKNTKQQLVLGLNAKVGYKQ